MANTPPSKRQRVSSPSNAVPSSAAPDVSNVQPTIAPKITLDTVPPPSQPPVAAPTTPTSPNNPRKRTASQRSPQLDTRPPPVTPVSEPSAMSIPKLLTEDSGSKKRGRTNTPWTAAEEQRLKQMRDVGNSWGDIAKAFPNRTEGSVKKHWYKDMHYAEFAEDESAALREAIKEYEANKWKAIGQKLGKPAKACEQYAREHFKNL